MATDMCRILSMAKKKPNKPGPKSDRLKIIGDWQDAMKKAVKKKKPREGWPDKSKKKSES